MSHGDASAPNQSEQRPPARRGAPRVKPGLFILEEDPPPKRPKPIPKVGPVTEASPALLDDSPEAPLPDTPPPRPAALQTALLMGAGGASASSMVFKLFWRGLLALVMLALGVAAYDLISDLLTRNIWLGRIALAILALTLGALLILVAREIAAFARARSLDAIRENAERGWRQGDRVQAENAAKALAALYASRPEMALPLRGLEARKGDLLDADALLSALERELMAPLDAAAQASVRRGARSAALATAMSPVALLDAGAALYLNLRMTREIAAIYGGRAGWLGSWRLFKRIAAHLMATGLIALGDDLLGPLMGGGAMAKLSRRFGEGLVNGALTARIGVTAMEICRPLPFEALKRPSVKAVALGALRLQQEKTDAS